MTYHWQSAPADDPSRREMERGMRRVEQREIERERAEEADHDHICPDCGMIEPCRDVACKQFDLVRCETCAGVPAGRDA